MFQYKSGWIAQDLFNSSAAQFYHKDGPLEHPLTTSEHT